MADQLNGLPPEFPEASTEESFDGARAWRPLLAIIIATAVFSLAREILAPVTAAILLGIILNPVVSRLERLIGRIAASAVVVLFVIGALGVAIYFLTVELTVVAAEVAGYSDNIAAKLSSLEQHTPEWLQRVETGVSDVQHQLQRGNGKSSHARTATVVQSPASSIPDLLKPAIPVLSGVLDTLLVVVLLFFMLIGSTDLRDRMVRLAARAKITIASEAIETAIGTVSRYLLYFSLSNLMYGLLVGLALWMIGLSHPAFWGGLAFAARYIPYVGAMLSAILPSMVAFAIFPGWGPMLEVLTTFIVLDQVQAQLVEPFLIGGGIGVAPVALLISAMYWAWLWGPVGLLFATPLTACLKIAGDYVAPLNFLSVLLGSKVQREDYQTLYSKLLELDFEGARQVATRLADEEGFEAAILELLLPALKLAARERAQDHVSDEVGDYIASSIRQIGEQLGNRFNRPRIARARVLGVCPPGERRFVELLLFLELLRYDGIAAGFSGEKAAPSEIREYARRFAPDQICLFVATPEVLASAIELVRELHAALPHVNIIATGDATAQADSELLKAGATRIAVDPVVLRRLLRAARPRRAAPPLEAASGA
jgi:predicted PurR-regulated permease PerM